jgi:glycolate oxidase iron-sulfur subunit
MLLLEGCVQPAMLPGVNAATARVLDLLGIETVVAAGATCCGAIRGHLGDAAGALDSARRNIDAWWAELERGCEAIVINASGCGAMVREYAHLLRGDPRYAARAARVSELALDVSEIAAQRLPQLQRLAPRSDGERIAFHAPCTLQHGLRLRGVVERVLAALGAELVPVADAHLCCGSAGTYSILQPTLSGELRARKLEALCAARPELVLSANVGCIAHLGAAAAVPVRHWIEWVDARCAAGDSPSG